MDWFKHLFWLLGNLYRGILFGDEIRIAESWFWLKVHLQYDYSTQSGMENTKENRLTVLFGIVITVWILLVTVLFVKIIHQNVV